MSMDSPNSLNFKFYFIKSVEYYLNFACILTLLIIIPHLYSLNIVYFYPIELIPFPKIILFFLLSTTYAKSFLAKLFHLFIYFAHLRYFIFDFHVKFVFNLKMKTCTMDIFFSTDHKLQNLNLKAQVDKDIEILIFFMHLLRINKEHG